MKKKIMTIALALSALCVLPSVAKNPDNNNTPAPTCQAGACSQEQSCRGNRPERKANRPNPFEGITLSPEQQTALSAIENQRPGRAQVDSTARAQARQARKEARRNYLNQVKEVLTPDQYVTFLENIAMQHGNRGNRHARQDMRQGNRPRQEMTQGNRQVRHNRQGNRPAPRDGQRQPVTGNSNK
ncbi:MAG: hypothetical protein K2M00_09060 [Muribaculaceae bacterium]|nr:hypothetical protein [Muribaculaceae bacterium]